MLEKMNQDNLYLKQIIQEKDNLIQELGELKVTEFSRRNNNNTPGFGRSIDHNSSKKYKNRNRSADIRASIGSTREADHLRQSYDRTIDSKEGTTGGNK